MDDPLARRRLIVGIALLIFFLTALIGEAMTDRIVRFWLGVALCSLVALVALVTVAFAHDPDRPDLDSWYPTLQSGRGPCCDGSDFGNGTAAHLSDVDWESKDGHYRVRIEGEWVDVPDNAVINLPNRDGRALIWFYHIDGHPVPRCFMPGAGT